MAKKVRVSEFTDYIQFYKQQTVFDEEEIRTHSEWAPCFKKWARVKVIFREQLESIISGGTTLRNRLELTLRTTDRIDSTMRFEYQGAFYNISIIGDKTGRKQETSLLGETVMDGGE